MVVFISQPFDYLQSNSLGVQITNPYILGNTAITPKGAKLDSSSKKDKAPAAKPDISKTIQKTVVERRDRERSVVFSSNR